MAKRKATKQIQEVKLPQVEVLKSNATKGLPEAGASLGYSSCSRTTADEIQ